MQLLTKLAAAAALAACAAHGALQEDSIGLLQHGVLQPEADSVKPEADSVTPAPPAAKADGAAESVQQNTPKPKPPKAAAAAAAARRKNNNKKKHMPKAKEANLEPGQNAQMRIEIGEFRGRLLPCTVKARRMNGRYHVRIPTQPLSVDLFNIPGTHLEVVNASTPFDAIVRNFRELQEVTKLAAQAEKEAHLRTRKEVAGRPNMTPAQVQKTVNSLRRGMEQEMIAEAVALGCPGSSVLKVGGGRPQDRVGKDLPKKVYGEEKAEKVDTLELCGHSCSTTTGCAAFEWSPVRKTCMMFKVSVPFYTKPGARDTIFCSLGAQK